MSNLPRTPRQRLFIAPYWLLRPPASATSLARFGPHLAWAMLGILVVGITVPCVLTWLHNHGGLFPLFPDSDSIPISHSWSATDLLLLEVIALIGCGPGALILTLLLFHLLRRSGQLENETERGVMLQGAMLGALLAFFNFPGYLSSEFYKGGDSGVMLLRIGLLFAVTGATCGAWTAWQVYRAKHPERGLFPRFSLFTLVCAAMAWGVLLIVFMPSL